MRAYLPRTVPCTITLQRRQAVPVQDVCHLSLSASETGGSMFGDETEPEGFFHGRLNDTEMRRRVPPSPTQPETRRCLENRPRDTYGRTHSLQRHHAQTLPGKYPLGANPRARVQGVHLPQRRRHQTSPVQAYAGASKGVYPCSGGRLRT